MSPNSIPDESIPALAYNLSADLASSRGFDNEDERPDVIYLLGEGVYEGITCLGGGATAASLEGRKYDTNRKDFIASMAAERKAGFVPLSERAYMDITEVFTSGIIFGIRGLRLYTPGKF